MLDDIGRHKQNAGYYTESRRRTDLGGRDSYMKFD